MISDIRSLRACWWTVSCGLAFWSRLAPAWLVGASVSSLGRAGELGFTDVVAPWPRAEGYFTGQESVLESVAAEVLPTA